MTPDRVPAAPQKGARRRVGRRCAAAALVALALLLAGGVWGYGAARHALTAYRALQRVQAVAADGGALAVAGALPAVRADLTTAAAEMREVQGAVGWLRPLLGGLGWLPVAGPDLVAAPHLLDMAAAGLSAAEAGLAGGGPALEAALNGGGMSGAVAGLAAGAPDLVRAEAALLEVEAARRRITRVGDARLQRLLAQADAYLPRAQAGVRAALAAPGLLGTDGPRTYLVLGQNNDELRATGGFIGTAGLVTLERAQVTAFDYRDAYAFRPLRSRLARPAPHPYAEWMLAEDWQLQDSNWWADFPTSVAKAEQMLREDQGLRVDGAVALDQEALRRLTQHLGAINVPEFDTQVNAANVLQVIESFTHPPGYTQRALAPEVEQIKLGDRKAFLAALGKAMVRQFQQLEAGRAVDVARTAAGLLAEKHLLMTVRDPEGADLLRAQGWSGAVPAVEGDALMAVETNIGFNKANKTVQRKLAYEVRLTPDLSVERAEAAISYTATDTRPAGECSLTAIDFVTAADSCYKSYVRIYAPPDSALLAMEGFDTPPEVYVEGQRTVFAAALVLLPGQSRQVKVAYRPPRNVVLRWQRPTYRLTVQKQPGSDAVPFSFRLTLPPGLRAAESSPGQLLHEESGVRWETDLKYDRGLWVGLEGGSPAP